MLVRSYAEGRSLLYNLYCVMLLNTIKKLIVFFMCTSPLERHRKLGNRYVTDLLPCGKCSECLKKAQNAYVVRCIEEGKKRGNMWFITLTYNENSVPKIDFVDEVSGEEVKVNTLRREDIKKWKREVRRSYKKTFNRDFPDFSFLICGEYGPRTFRQCPHYHGVLFGLDNFHKNYLESYWKENYGFSVFKYIPTVSLNGHDDLSCVARYVSKYCIKPADIEHPLVKDGIVEKPRKLTSIGFGLPQNFSEMRDHILNGHDLHDRLTLAQVNIINSRCNYVYNGFKYALPLYYRKKIFYEVGLNQNLVSSPLSKVCTNTLRSRISKSFDRKLREYRSKYSKREVASLVSRYVEGEENSLQSREDVASKDIKRAYKSSKF